MGIYRGIFWNVERFFDVTGGPVARTLGGTQANAWNRKAFDLKLRNVCAVLDRLGNEPPVAFIGLCEIETKPVLDAIQRKLGWSQMVNLDDFTQAGGLEGYDVTLLFNADLFETPPRSVRSISLNNVFQTRDILAVELCLKQGGHPIQLYVVHWPSRVISEGRVLRLAHAHYLKTLLDQLIQYRRADLVDPAGQVRMPPAEQLRQRWKRPALVLGDLNDEPFDLAVRQGLLSKRDTRAAVRQANLTSHAVSRASTYLRKKVRLFNPTWQLLSGPGPGGTFYREGTWRVYDQVLATHGALIPGSAFRLLPESVKAFREETLSYDGAEIRMTSRNGIPQGFNAATGQGISDHLPLQFDLEIAV